MKVSYFETARYLAPRKLPAEWPVPPDAYDREAGAQAYRGMIERLQFVEALGFDWVSVSEHHYSPQRLTPAPIVSAAHLAAYAQRIKIAVLGPIVSQSNPVQVAEELAMLDNLMPGRLVVGLLRGITGEYLTYGLNPSEARERTTEGMELVLKAWTEPQPFGWQGRHFQFRTVSVWPRPLQQPHPPTYALGSSRESCEFAARHHLGLGVSYAPFEVVAKATRYYREACAQYGWRPSAGADHLPGEYSDRRDRRKSQRVAGTAAGRTEGFLAAPQGSRRPAAARIPAISPAKRGRRMSAARCRRISSAGRIRSSSRSSAVATRSGLVSST